MIRRAIFRILAVAVAAAIVGDVSARQNRGRGGRNKDRAEREEEREPTSTIKTRIVTPTKLAAGQSAETVIRLTAGAKPVTPDDLKVAHTEKLHLLIIDETLTDYHHEHPVPSDRPGEYRFQFKPKYGGTYHIWADVVPTATGKQEYSKTTLKVTGPAASRKQQTNEVAEVDGYKFEMTTEDDAPLESGKATLVSVKVTGPDGKPFSGLEPVMGAYAHIVGFPEEADSVVHVHPMGEEPTSESQRGGPELSFHIMPEDDGFHKIFLQTRIGGADKFVGFGVNVREGDGEGDGHTH
jgi:hypothetical protein